MNYKILIDSVFEMLNLGLFENFTDIVEAIAREKQLKAGSRKKKLLLIEKMNPDWKDLNEELE